MSVDDGLRPLVRAGLSRLGWLVVSVETGGTGRGISDSWWAAQAGGETGWLEMKAESSLGAVGLRPEQVAFIHGVRARGARADVAVRYRHGGGPRKGAPTDELWLLRGDPRVIRREGLTPDAPWVLGRWLGGPASWRWDAVAALLAS